FGPAAAGFGEGLSGFMGTSQFALAGVYNHFPEVVFHWSFAATSATIVSGAAAGRVKFLAYVLLSFLQSTFVYPFVAHVMWSKDGWFYKLGVIDLAGQGAVHLLGGTIGLVATIFLGPRAGVFTSSGRYLPIRASPLNAAFGTLILWYCWFEFNSGSTITLTNGRDIVAAIVSWNTGLASGAGTAAALLLSYARSRALYVDVFEVITGLLSGLVAITGPAAVVDGWAAILIGAMGAVVGIYAGELVVKRRIDDPVGAVAIHVCVAAYGLIMTGFFAVPPRRFRGNTLTGIFYGGDGTLLGVQLLALVSIVAWGLLTGIALMFIVDRTFGMRISSSTEAGGVDEKEHNVVAIRLDELDSLGSGRSRSSTSPTSGDDEDSAGEPLSPEEAWVSTLLRVTTAGLGGRGGDLDSSRSTDHGSPKQLKPGLSSPGLPRPSSLPRIEGSGAGRGGPTGGPIRPQPKTPAQLAKEKARAERKQRKLAKRLMRLTASMMHKANSSEVVFVPATQAKAARRHYAKVARAGRAGDAPPAKAGPPRATTGQAPAGEDGAVGLTRTWSSTGSSAQGSVQLDGLQLVDDSVASAGPAQTPPPK
ncbi:amt-3, partial [Symbiodinium sp. KB8]